MSISSESLDDQTIQLTAVPSDETLRKICEAADVIACECPGYLVRLLRQIRTFRNYTHSCIENFPEDKETHLWLCERAEQWEQQVYQTIVELMQRENLLNGTGELSLTLLHDRATSIALKQIGK